MHSIEYRYFYQSALDLSIRKASNNLNINSSAIVRQVQKLEERLEVKLFIRNSKGLEMTEEGKALFEHLSEQNERNSDFLSDLKKNKNNEKGEIKISSGETFAVQYLSPIIFKFRFKFRDIKIRLFSRQPNKIVDDLITGKADFGITFTKELPKTLKVVFQCNFPMGILCSPQHKLASKDNIDLEDCLNFPLLFHPGTVTFWNRIQREVGIKLFSVNPNLIANSFSFIKNYLIEDPSYITFFSNIGSAREIERKELIFKSVNHKLFSDNQVGIIVPKNKKLNNYTNFLISLVEEEFEKRSDC
tara:strand:- start:945 stop:1850 length:906 start_codon:yes stop_codon:yes gene_type:complete